MDNEKMVDMGKYVMGQVPDILVSLGLGSCVGLVLYVPRLKKGAMVHIMLPSSEGHKNADSAVFDYNRFADIAIANMLKDLDSAGIHKNELKAKMAGGAHMFSTTNQDMMDIGRKNVESVKSLLHDAGIPLVAEDTLGSLGRTIRFNFETCNLTIKTKEGIHDI